MVYNDYLPCCLDKLISISTPSISTLMKYWLMSPSMILWITSKIYRKNCHSISLKEKKEKLRDIINSSFNAKEAKNGSNYRKSLPYVSTWLIEFLSNYFVTTLFVTLSGIKVFLVFLWWWKISSKASSNDKFNISTCSDHPYLHSW